MADLTRAEVAEIRERGQVSLLTDTPYGYTLNVLLKSAERDALCALADRALAAERCDMLVCPFEERAKKAEERLRAVEQERDRLFHAAMTHGLEMENAVRAFLVKWDEAKPYIDGVSQIAQVHGCPYGGPTLGVEIDALRAASKVPAPPPPAEEGSK